MKASDARVLLTGAGGGIGRAMADTLRGAGAQVLGVGRREGPGPWVQADLARVDGLAAVTGAAAAFGANVIQALLPALRRLPQAQVVFVGSALGRIGLPGFSAYGASKAGLHGFAEALRRELADTPVKVQILGPRSTRTAFNDAAVEAYNRATGTAMDDPEVVAGALLALIEGEAAERFIGFPERLGVRLNGVLGVHMDGSFRRHRRHLSTPNGVTA
jgi:short-subunit dehydrogenase